MRLHTLLAAATLIIVLTVPTGCWDRREIETLAFINTAAIDRPADGEGIRISVQIVKPFVFGAEEPGELQERAFWLTGAEGRTVGEASASLREHSPRVPFWAHNLHLVLGEDFARGGVAEITGFFTRDPETRRRVHMMVVREGRGEDLLGAEFELQRLPAIALEQMVLANERFIGTTVSSELHEFLIALETEGIEPLVPAVRIVERPPEGDIRGEIERAAVYRSAKIDGAAVFCADRLTGWLDGREARGAAWVRGQIQSTKLVIPHPGEEGEHASLRVTEADSRVQMQMKGGRLMARVTIGASADLVELTAPVDPFAHYRMWREMETAMAALIEEEVNEAVRTARDDFGADVFGFGRQLARQDPEVWRGMERDWAAQFSDLTVHVRVEAEIRESGLLMRAPRPGTGD